jgi:hypothetical protein
MNLGSLSRKIAALAARAPRSRSHRGLLVVFRASDGDGHPLPLPPDAPPIREPEARPACDGIDVVFIHENGTEIWEEMTNAP